MHADIGIGIIFSILITHFFGVEINAFYILGGIIFVLLPDIDILSFVHPWFKKIFQGHREWTHHPLKYLPIAVVLLFIAGPVWVLLFFLCIFFHFVHDSLWIGPGVAWLGPFSKKHYKFFNIEKPYSPGPITWFKDYYFRPTIISITETGVFIAAVILLCVTY